MPTLQRFKLFATQCAAINIPTQSPTTSPLFLRHRNQRRRKTLRMLLTCRSTHISDHPQSKHQQQQPATVKPKRSKLKDLFYSASSSPTNFNHRGDYDGGDPEQEFGIGPKRSEVKIGMGPVRPMAQMFGFRNKMLLRKPWRPVLTTIEEMRE